MEKSHSMDIMKTALVRAVANRFAEITDKYGDDYPIILYDPQIKFKEKTFKDMVKANSSINLFSDLGKVFGFADSLGISFVMILPSDYEEAKLFSEFRWLKYIYERRMFDIEEEAFLKDLFKNASDRIIKSMKAYVFCTLLDFMTEANDKKDEEDVIIMCDVKEIAKKFREEFIVIWYDPDVCPESKQKLEEDIEIEIEEKNIYTEFGDLYERLKNYNDIPYHLIMSRGDKVEKILKEIYQQKDLLGLYIYCKTFKLEEKIDQERVEIRDTIEELVPRIKNGIRTRSKLKNTLPAFMTNFDIPDRTDIYEQHYSLKGLINFQNRRQAKEDFLKLARKIYQGQDQEQDKELDRFDKSYNEFNKEEILRWYTSQSPIYKLINNCLRIATADSILYCRLILKDLESAIREQYQQESKDFCGEVYRGAFVSADEWENLEKNIGQEIEMSGFLSTSMNQQTTLNFLKGDPQNKIFIKIIIPHLPELDEQGFADISKFSHLEGEKEILFNVRSRFKILEVRVAKIEGTRIKCRQVVLLYGAQLLRRYITEKEPSNIIELELPPDVKCGLCGSRDKLFNYYDQRETFINCLECLIKCSMPKDVLLVALDGEKEKQIGKVLQGAILKSKEGVTFSHCGYKCHDCEAKDKEKYYKWLSCDGENALIQCSGCLEKKRTIEGQILLLEGSPYTMWQEQQKEWEKINSNYQGILWQEIEDETQGNVFLEIQEYQKCIEYGEKVIDKLKNKRRREFSKFNIFRTLGNALPKVEKHQQALKYLTICLNISQFIDGRKSQVRASLYQDIANIYANLHEHYKALEYYYRSLTIQVFLNGENHVGTASSYHGLASIYQSLCDFPIALIYYKKTIQIQKSLFGENRPEMAVVYTNIATLYNQLGDYKNAIEYFNMAISINEAIYGGKHPNTAAIYRSLSSFYADLGDYQTASNYLNKALDVQTSIFGTNHSALVSPLNKIGDIHLKMGRYQEALECFNKALDIQRSVSGENCSTSAVLLNNIGNVYQSIGDNQKSLEYFFRALNLRKSIFAEEHVEVANSYNNIGSAYISLGKHKEALEYVQKALRIQKLLYPKHHQHIAISHNNLAEIYRNLGEYDKALDFYKNARDTQLSLTGEKHPQIAIIDCNLGSLYLHIGKYDKALEYQKNSLDIKASFYGAGVQNPDIALSYNNLAFTYRKLGKYDQALEYNQKALDIQRSNFDEKYPDLIASESNLGLVYERLGEDQKALKILTKVLDMRKLIFGELNPDTAISYDNLGIMHQKLGNYQKSLELHMKALDIKESILSEIHPEMAISFSHLASVFSSLGKYEQAKEYCTKVLNIQKSIYTEEHSDLAISYHNLARVHFRLGEYSQAVEYLLKSIDIQKSIFGDTHPDIATLYESLGEVYCHSGEHQKSFELQEKSLKIRKSILGEKHPAIAASYSNLGTSSHVVGEHQKAKAYYLKAIDLFKNFYGEQHRPLATLYVGLWMVYADLGDYQNGIKFYAKAVELDGSIFDSMQT